MSNPSLPITSNHNHINHSNQLNSDTFSIGIREITDTQGMRETIYY